MGGRGSSSRIGGKNFDAPLNESKVGSTYKSLPKSFQENIKNNLRISPEMKRDIENGRRNKMTDEWSTGLTGSKTKMKVITDASSNGTITYTAKIRNKVIIKTTSKESIANTVAKFYVDEMKKRK